MTEKKAKTLAERFFEITTEQKALDKEQVEIAIQLLDFSKENKVDTIGPALIYEKTLAPKLVLTKKGEKLADAKSTLLHAIPKMYTVTKKTTSLKIKDLYDNKSDEAVKEALKDANLKLIRETKRYIKHI